MLERGAILPGCYGKLSAMMGAQKELAIFRQYSDLNAKNLLYLQAEIFHLEAEQAEIEAEDQSSEDPEKALFSRSFWHLKRSQKSGGQGRQWLVVLEIRELLKEYNTALLQQAEINKLERPDKSSLGRLKEWLGHPEGGHFFPYGRERRIWDVEDLGDLVALSTLSSRHGEADRLTNWLNASLLPWCHRHGAQRFITPTTDPHGNIYYDYNERLLVSLASITSTVLASLLPTIAIFALYFVKNTLARLGAIMAFSGMFSLALSALTRARKVEIFGACAAFAAVQVVFVGGFNGYGST